MTRIVWTLVVTLLLFTITVLVYNFMDKQVQPELIVAFFGAITGELVAMGGIKIAKVKQKKDDAP